MADDLDRAGDLDHVARIQAEWARERPDLDVSPQGVIGRLHRLAGLLTEQLCVVYRRFGLSEGEFDVLATLRRAGDPFERAPSELSEHTMVTTGAMTKRLDRLERAGLVSRRRSEADGRGRVVALTDAGRDVHRAHAQRTAPAGRPRTEGGGAAPGAAHRLARPYGPAADLGRAPETHA
jgi:DNA-binding MarR family transcriptional regulator